MKCSCPFKPCQARSRSDKIAESISVCPFRLAASAPKDVERRSALRSLTTVTGTKALRCEQLQCYHCFNPSSCCRISGQNRPLRHRDGAARHWLANIWLSNGCNGITCSCRAGNEERLTHRSRSLLRRERNKQDLPQLANKWGSNV